MKAFISKLRTFIIREGFSNISYGYQLLGLVMDNIMDR